MAIGLPELHDGVEAMDWLAADNFVLAIGFVGKRQDCGGEVNWFMVLV